MIWRLHSRPLACALALGALLLAGCGADEEGTIPPDQAAQLEDTLDQVEQDFDDNLCDELPASIEDVQAQVQSLPETIDPELRTALSEGVGRLNRLGDKDCEEPEPEPTTPTQPPTAPTIPPEPTEPPTTQDTEPETETETETETEEVEPPQDGDDSSGPGSGGNSGSLPPDDDEGDDS